MSDWTPPSDLYCVRAGGIEWHVDRATYKEIDTWLDSLDLVNNPDNLFSRKTFDDITEAEVSIFARDVVLLYISTREGRRRDRLINQMNQQEEKELSADK